MAEKKVTLTKADSHRATERGYAGGAVIEPGELVPPDTPVGSWMERVDGKTDALDEAVQAALDPQPGDIDLTQLGKAALQAMAAERDIPTAGLSKEDLITAIKAHKDPLRG